MTTSIISSSLSKDSVDQLVDHLQAENIIPVRDISVLAPNEEAEHKIGAVSATKLKGDKNSGRISAAATGGILGLATGIAGMALPGLGALIVIGPLVAILGGVAAGQEAQGPVDTLERFGATNAQANVFVDQLKQGAYLVIVHNVNATTEGNILAAFKQFKLDPLVVRDETALSLS